MVVSARNDHLSTSSISHTSLMKAIVQDSERAKGLISNISVEILMTPNEFGENAFLFACAQGKTDIARLILQRLGENALITTDNNRNNALMLAALGGHLETVQFLSGCYINSNSACAVNVFGCNAFMLAALCGRTQVVEFLALFLPKKALSVKDKSGNNAFLLAAKNGEFDTLRLLSGPFYILDQESINAVNNAGQNALMLAAKNGHTLAVIYLLTCLNPINLCAVDHDDNSALQLAEEFGHRGTVAALRSQSMDNSTQFVFVDDDEERKQPGPSSSESYEAHVAFLEDFESMMRRLQVTQINGPEPEQPSALSPSSSSPLILHPHSLKRSSEQKTKSPQEADDDIQGFVRRTKPRFIPKLTERRARPHAFKTSQVVDETSAASTGPRKRNKR